MITCSACGYDKNPVGAEFCDACGSELASVSTLEESIDNIIQPEVLSPQTPEPNDSISTATFYRFTVTPGTARLISKEINARTSEFTIDGNAIVGIFDPDMGPVDIDLEEFPGGETVSRNHAEIYQEDDIWKIKDLGSTNGTFIKAGGQTRFGARITIPEAINPGDEIAFGKVRFFFQIL